MRRTTRRRPTWSARRPRVADLSSRVADLPPRSAAHPPRSAAHPPRSAAHPPRSAALRALCTSRLRSRRRRRPPADSPAHRTRIACNSPPSEGRVARGPRARAQRSASRRSPAPDENIAPPPTHTARRRRRGTICRSRPVRPSSGACATSTTRANACSRAQTSGYPRPRLPPGAPRQAANSSGRPRSSSAAAAAAHPRRLGVGAVVLTAAQARDLSIQLRGPSRR
jgi:hypothetical protein